MRKVRESESDKIIERKIRQREGESEREGKKSSTHIIRKVFLHPDYKFHVIIIITVIITKIISEVSQQTFDINYSYGNGYKI